VQLPFQIAIMISGNYNWFNIHTAVLLLPAWDKDTLTHAAGHRDGRGDGGGSWLPRGAPSPAGIAALISWPMRVWSWFWDELCVVRWACYALSVGALLYAGVALFPIEKVIEMGQSPREPFERGLGRGRGVGLDAHGPPDSYGLPWTPMDYLGAVVGEDHRSYRITNRITDRFLAELLDTMLTPTSYALLYGCLGASCVAHIALPWLYNGRAPQPGLDSPPLLPYMDV
jgi:hypothetical protein